MCRCVRYLLVFIYLLSFSVFGDEPLMTFEDVEAEAWFFNIQQRYEAEPWLEPAVDLFMSELEAHPSLPRVANHFFTAAEQHGRQVKNILDSGKSPEQIEREIKESEGDMMDLLIKQVGVLPIPYAKAASLITQSVKDASEERKRKKNNVMRPDFQKGLNDGGSDFRKWAGKNKQNIDDFNRYSLQPYRLHHDSFTTRVGKYKNDGNGGGTREIFRSLMERKAGYNKPSEATPEKLLADNTEFAGSQQGRLTRLFITAAKDEIIGLLTEFFGKEGFRASSIERKVDKIIKEQEKQGTALERLEKALNEKNFNLEKVERALTDRLKEIQSTLANETDERNRQALQEEQERLETYQQRIDQQKKEELYHAADATAAVVQHFGSITRDPEVIRFTNGVATVFQSGKRLSQLSDMNPITGAGKFAVSMDMISVGLTLGKMLGAFEDPNNKMFEAIAKLHQDMMSRFDRLENIMGRYHEAMQRHFQAVHATLAKVLEGQREQMIVLRELNAKVDGLARAVALLDLDGHAATISDELRALDEVENDYLIRRKTPLEQRDMELALGRFAMYGVERTDKETLIGMPEEMKNEKLIPNFRAALTRLQRRSDQYETVDLTLQLEDRFLNIPFVAEKRVPFLSLWERASGLYLQLAEQNRNRYRFDLDLNADLTALRGVGVRIKKALLAGRQPARLAAWLDIQARLYRGVLLHLQRDWQRFNVLAPLGLPIGPEELRKKLTPPAVELPTPDGKQTTIVEIRQKQFKQKKELAKLLPEAQLKRGHLYVHFENGDFKQTLTNPKAGWEIVPPAVKLLVHLGMQSSDLPEDLLKEEYAVHIRASIVGWTNNKPVLKSEQQGTAVQWYVTAHTAESMVQFEVWTKQMKGPISYQAEHPYAEARFPFAKKIKCRKGSKLLQRFYDEQPQGSVEETEQRVLKERTSAMAQNWDSRLISWNYELSFPIFGLPAHQSPTVPQWNPDPSLAFDPILAVLTKLRGQVAQELKDVVKRENKIKPQYLIPEGNVVLNEKLDELDAVQAIVKHHLELFAPDYLLVSTLTSGPLEESTPGRPMVARMIDEMFTFENDNNMMTFPAGFAKEPELNDRWNVHVMGKLGVFRGAEMSADYAKYLEDLKRKPETADFNPQCQAVTEMLGFLEAEQTNRP